jgi:HSP20 family protein
MAKEGPREMERVEPARALTPFEEIEQRFQDFFRRPFPLQPSFWPRMRVSETEEVSPKVDIYDEADSFVVKAEIPGIKKEDVEVNLTNDMITISGEKKREEEVEKKGFYRMECSYGSFSRSFRLPEDVQTDKAKATFKDGVLEVKIPKTEEAKKKEKKVDIE